ncbi:MAG: hypothetical protein IIZ59_00795 [Clostridia bacterium]|nr:hypothetical protein [Clostridia bacterium]
MNNNKDKDKSAVSAAQNSAWQRFAASGSVADYLSYSAIRHNEETQNENRDGRNSHKGTDGSGRGQNS